MSFDIIFWAYFYIITMMQNIECGTIRIGNITKYRLQNFFGAFFLYLKTIASHCLKRYKGC